MASFSPLQNERIDYKPKLPTLLEKAVSLTTHPLPSLEEHIDPAVKDYLPITSKNLFLAFNESGAQNISLPLRVGVVLSGGQAPGGNNVIAGLFDALKKIHPDSVLIGFLNGPSGIINNKSIEITAPFIHSYRNQGGFDSLGSGRTKIETEEQFTNAEETVTALGLNGLVIVGGDDSNTNAAFLAEYFKKREIPVNVVGVPKTIDGDLRNEHIEVPFGFDTASKVYSEMIGNLLKDAISSKKYYFFVKLMGRSASHITLECALRTHPNIALIGEEIAVKGITLSQIIQQIVSLIVERAKQGKDYGVLLIPEGLIEFIPEIKKMLQELNSRLSKGNFDVKSMSPNSKACFERLPKAIQDQLLMDRDPHGNIQVSKIETERLLIELVDIELKKLKAEDAYQGKFNPQPLFFGYEGRSALPSNFDSNYAYTLGYTAAHLLNNKASGYMASVKNLPRPYTEWEVLGVPIYSLMNLEERGGKMVPVIKKSMVDLSSKHFKAFEAKRKSWLFDDDYISPGPIQFFGPPKFTDTGPLTI